MVRGGREALGLGNRSIKNITELSIFGSISIWDGSELGLTWPKKSSSYFKNNFHTFLLPGISNTSIFKVRDVLNCVNFLVMKTFSNIFHGTLCWGKWYLNIFYTSIIYFLLLLTSITFKWCFCWYSWWWGFFPVFSWSWIHITLIRSRHFCNRHWSRINMQLLQC